jgi:SRSO17 transposase
LEDRLLIRRRKRRPHQFTFCLTRSPEETSLVELVRVAGQRWRIESCFEEAKGETGLDEYEVRARTGFGTLRFRRWHMRI